MGACTMNINKGIDVYVQYIYRYLYICTMYVQNCLLPLPYI